MLPRAVHQVLPFIDLSGSARRSRPSLFAVGLCLLYRLTDRAARPADRAPRDAVPGDLAARLRLLDGLRREPVPGAGRRHRSCCLERQRTLLAMRRSARSRCSRGPVGIMLAPAIAWQRLARRRPTARPRVRIRAVARAAAAGGRARLRRSTCGGGRAIRSRRRTRRHAAGAAAPPSRRSLLVQTLPGRGRAPGTCCATLVHVSFARALAGPARRALAPAAAGAARVHDLRGGRRAPAVRRGHACSRPGGSG